MSLLLVNFVDFLERLPYCDDSTKIQDVSVDDFNCLPLNNCPYFIFDAASICYPFLLRITMH